MTDYDAIVIGSGAGGGVAAHVLTQAGKRVLLLERGRPLNYQDEPHDHLRNQRFSRYGHNAGPDVAGNPRVIVTGENGEVILPPHAGGYSNNAATLGGGTRVYGAQAWRFLPDDFQMASRYGVPQGSSLADWPIAYNDLAPFYEQAEWDMGVAGDSETSARHWQRRTGFPMPPLPVNPQGRLLRAGAARLGWSTLPIPVLINTVPYAGREACIQCQYCVGYPCPVDAKNGTHNTAIARALATGHCTLLTSVMVEQIDTDAHGHVVGVSYLDENNLRHQPRATIVICAAGAIETARLLLNSTSTHHPAGLGNQHDQVGRNLQGHYYPAAVGLMPDAVYDGLGPGISTATVQFNHGNDGIIGGAMLADEFIEPPINFWARNLPPHLPRWGLENKRFMRNNYKRVMRVTGPVQEIPNPEARVTVDPTVRDRWGLSVARLSGTGHYETVRTASAMFERAREWLLASGAEQVWGQAPGLFLSGGQHQAGTCRMGHDPRTSVVDSWGRVHRHDNLFITDGSVHVTNGGFNPVLTIMALSFRAAGHIVENW